MSFFPEKGIYSREEFSSSDGAIFDNAYLQGITGGCVTLLNTRSGSISAIKTWRDVYDWSLEDNLISLTLIDDLFTVLSGVTSSSIQNTLSGSVIVEGGAEALTILTDYPSYVSGYGFSGAGTFGIGLFSGSPNQIIYSGFSVGGVNKVTVEFDVASYNTYSGLDTLSGFSEGEINLTGLPALSGIVGHGVFFCNTTNWDFIEITPYGVRSLNHPEIAIPHNFLNPTRVRLAFGPSDLFISLEDGKTIAGYNKFNTQISTPGYPAFLFFGSITKDWYSTPFGNYNAMQNISASVGRTKWDNIKILTGQIALHEDYANEIYYTTGYTNMYTSTFDPGISIQSYVRASVGYKPYEGGTTIITAQYSGAGGWTDSVSATLTGRDYSTVLNLNTVPIYLYPRSDLGLDYLSNPIRFKIAQKSSNGNKLPPVVEWIELFASKDRVRIDLLPDWKVADITTDIKLAIESGSFTSDDPTPDNWTRLLVNIPYSGNFSGQGITGFLDEAYNIPIRIFGQGEVVPDGRYRSSYKNFVETTLTALLSGSEAYQYFGSTPTNNLFPNPIFDQGFRPVTSGEPRFSTGFTDGLLASSTQIPQNYTGTYKIDYIKDLIYRPEAQARANRINSINGNSSILDEFAQGVYIYPNPTNHNGTAGIELYTPSGIATGSLLISLDVQIANGTEIELSLFSTTTGVYRLPGSLFRDYRTVSFPYTSPNDNRVYARLAVPSGYAGEEYRFTIDNVSVSPYSSSYLNCTGLLGYLHNTGVAQDYYTGASIGTGSKVPHNRSATYLYTDLYLHSYPSSQSGVLVRLLGQDSRGLELNIDPTGYLHALVNTISDSWSELSGTSYLEILPSQELVSVDRVPLGKWTNIGFCHDVHTYSKFSYKAYSGEIVPSNIATNRGYLTIDGKVSASKDMISGWTRHVATGSGTDSAPYITYIPLSGLVTATISSGLVCSIDALELGRPPVLDVEETLSINAARNYTPYFTPDPLFTLGNSVVNLLTTGSDYKSIGKDLYIGSCYNFSSPTQFANWDKGAIRNHAVVYGAPSNILDCPYTGYDLYSSRVSSGNYYIAKYSSTYHRLNFSTGQLRINPSQTVEGPYNLHSSFAAAGWIKPHTTGTFLSLHQDTRYETGARVECSILDNKLIVNKYTTTGIPIVTLTGQNITMSDWNYLGIFYQTSGFYQEATTGYATVYISNTTGLYSTSTVSGMDVGLVYKGLTGDLSESQIKFGGTSDCQLFNWILPLNSNNLSKNLSVFSNDLHKSGRWQTLLEDGEVFTGNIRYIDYNLGLFTLGKYSTSIDKYFSVSLHNSYDSIPKLNGTLAYDDKPFKIVKTYNLIYDTSVIDNIYGSTTSVVRVGNVVPPNAINIAKFSSPSFTPVSSVSTLDLSDYNTSNLITYKNGEYVIGGSTAVDSSLSGYRGINLAIYSGRKDITISGQVVSPDVELSTINIIDPSFKQGYPAYYYYLLGRGNKALKIADAYSHYTGNIDRYSTGTIPDNYILNLEKVKNNVKLKDSKGDIIPPEEYPYDILISSVTTDLLSSAVTSGSTLYLDNIGPYTSGYSLPNGQFSVLLLTNKKYIEGKTIFAHYDAYDIRTEQEYLGFKEVVNAQPLYRERLPGEDIGIGKFDLSISQNNYYNIKVYGLESGYNV